MKAKGILTASLLALSLISAPAVAGDSTALAAEQAQGFATQDSGQTGGATGGQTGCPCPCPGGQMGGGMMGGHMGMKGGGAMMMQNHQLMQEAMGILKDNMAITRDMTHKPTAAQKTKLDTMIKRMDEIMKQHDTMMKSMQGMMGGGATDGTTGGSTAK